MVTVTGLDLEKGSLWLILITIVVSGLGLYFALVLTETIRTTIDTLLPPQDSPVAKAWINFAIAVVILIVLVFILIQIARVIRPD